MPVSLLFRVGAALSLVSAAAAHAQAPSTARQEITYLLDAVAQSHCQFNRNGTWYEGAEAKSHLAKKYDYLDKRKMAPTAEAFIEKGATASSMSGAAYQIRCPGAAPVASALWLGEQLARYRKQAR